MPAIVDRIGAGFSAARERSRALDHVVRTVMHYNDVKGNMQAGAITYFGFLSFFPLLALAFFAVGYVAEVYPDARENLTTALDTILPNMVGDDPGQLSLTSIQSAASTLGVIGLVGLVYAGLGWLSSTRTALEAIFERSAQGFTGFLLGKAWDLVAIVVIGVTLVFSVALSSVVTSFSTDLLDWVGLSTDLEAIVWVIGVVLGVLSSTLLFFALFALLGRPDSPRRPLWSGALVGAIGFEALKQASRWLLANTAEQPAFKAFGIALILVVWINYFSRVVLFAASWAHTSPTARNYRALRHEALGVTAPED